MQLLSVIRTDESLNFVKMIFRSLKHRMLVFGCPIPHQAVLKN